MPCRCAPTMSPSRSSPTIHVSPASASSASSAAAKYCGARLAEHRRLGVGGVLEPGDERARVEARRRRPSATSGSCAGSRGRRRPRSSRNARFRFRYEKTRPVSSPSSAPPISTASTFMPIELQALEVVEDAGHRQREHALALRARAPRPLRSSAAPRRRASMPIARRCSTSCARERVVVFVTKRIRWPRSRRRRTASTAPAIGSPETCSTPSTSRRIAAMDVESIRSEVAFRFSRSSGPGGQHAQKSSTRVEALFDVEASAALTDAERRRVLDEARPGRPRRSRRTSARSCATASSRPTGSSSSCARRRRCGVRGARRSRRGPPPSGGSTRRSAAARRSACGARPTTDG